MFDVWAHDALLAMYLVVIVSYCCMARLRGAAGPAWRQPPSRAT